LFSRMSPWGPPEDSASPFPIQRVFFRAPSRSPSAVFFFSGLQNERGPPESLPESIKLWVTFSGKFGVNPTTGRFPPVDDAVNSAVSCETGAKTGACRAPRKLRREPSTSWVRAGPMTWHAKPLDPTVSYPISPLPADGGGRGPNEPRTEAFPFNHDVPGYFFSTRWTDGSRPTTELVGCHLGDLLHRCTASTPERRRIGWAERALRGPSCHAA